MRARSNPGNELTQKLASGQLVVQICQNCGRWQYPPAERCQACLSDDLRWTEEQIQGTVVASAKIHKSYADDFPEGEEWWVASVEIKPGAICYAHVLSAHEAGAKVKLVALRDNLGDGVLGAIQSAGDVERLQAKFSKGSR
ncbi:MAG: zinc ribbon domain-containing protein [Pseudomonadota bacterium]